MTTVARKPATAPCRRRVSDWPCRIEGSSMTFTLRMRGTRAASSARAGAEAGADRRPPNAAQFEVLLCPPTAPVLLLLKERRFRYISDLWAALRQVIYLCMYRWGVGRKAQ